MNDLERALFEEHLLAISKGLAYPRTPNIAKSIRTRLRPSTRSRFISKRLARSLITILIFFSSLLLIPPARAAIIEFIQIGIVRIFPGQSDLPIGVTGTALPKRDAPVTATPAPVASTLLHILNRIAGETTLTQVQEKVTFPILLPSYPHDLGKPDKVFVQDADGAMVILVWLDPANSDRVAMSLHYIPAGSWAIRKVEPTIIQETRVNNQRAVWTVGPYPLRLSNGDLEFTRLVDGHVLIWAEADITYRLETDLSLPEALRIAESLQPISYQ